MSELYLIAHRVRGEPAFDVATHMTCPECHEGQRWEVDGQVECVECDGLGYWWIIPTSGHRAYPYDHQPLFECVELADWAEMPPDLPDHYPTRAAPTVGLAEALGLTAKRAPTPPILRRF